MHTIALKPTQKRRNKKHLSILLAGLMLFALNQLKAQAYIDFELPTEISNNFDIGLNETVGDSMMALSELSNIRAKIVEAGYLTAGFDSLVWSGDTLKAILMPGKRYKWAQLNPGNTPESYLSKTGFREKLYRNEVLTPKALSKLLTKVVDQAENNGYPFASLALDSIEIKKQTISATLNFEFNDFVVIDSLILKGEVKTNRKYLENYLNLENNRPYNQKLLNKIPSRLRELPFIKVIKPYEIGMRPGKADVYLYLDNKKASNFDGILGVLPDDDEAGEVTITGDIELNLLNSFKRGESINLQWQRLQTGTQELNLGFAYPFLFDTPIGSELDLELYRRDTLFSQVNSKIGLQYFLQGGNTVSVFYENNQSNVISSSFFNLGEYVDSRRNMFGLGIDFVRLDYRFNPSNGYFVNASLAAGTKKIEKNPEIDDEEYEGVELETDIYNLELNSGYYLPIGQRSTVLFRIRGGYLLNENLFRNEMYRIGGLKTLRGFNEQSIFASAFGVGTVEYRFILEQNSNFFVFFDQGVYEDRLRDSVISDEPFGFGAGINFETNAGIFSLT
ncbi:MAG: BamA/TamA family outer membrane protein, partial [Bacteroidetes bacterium]|nr:BamA/TamA family outer membrane protein [Bacteroidota bacterium]